MYPILANENLLSTILTAIRENRLAGCYLLEGAEGSGKLTIARYFSAALVCTSKREDLSPCLTCPSCKNALSGNHVDVFELRPEEEGKSIPVDKVRESIANMFILPSEGEWRIFIIENSESLRSESQNALLKSIEEPRPNTVFFLLTSDQSLLLPTVRSRAVKLKTEPLSKEQIKMALSREETPTTRLEEAAHLAHGSLGKAQRLLGDGEYFSAREKVLDYFKALLDGASFTKLCLIFPPEKLTRKDLSVILPMIKSALRDLMCKHYDPNTVSEWFTDENFVSDLASIISPQFANEFFELCQKLEQALLQNVNLFAALSGFHLTAQKLTHVQ